MRTELILGRYEAFRRASPDLVLFVKADGTYLDLWQGSQVLSAYPIELLAGQKIGDMMPEMQADLTECIHQALVTNDVIHHEFQTNDTSLVWYEARFSKANEDEVLIVIRDVTAAKALRARLEKEIREHTQKLQQSNDELQQFAYAASHDLREPLLKVTAFGNRLLELAKSDQMTDEKLTYYLGVIMSAAERMTKLIDDLLAYSRVGRKDDPMVQVSMAGVMREVQDILSEKIREVGASLSFSAMPLIMADSTQMVLLFQNLLSNALKYRKKTNKCHIKILYHDTDPVYHVFSVEDNGIGFDPKYKDRIFQIFERLHTRFDYPGTGVGLALCKKIVDRHGGWMDVTSAPDVGSTFTVYLPRKE